MSPIGVILNILWVVFGGFWTALAWAVAGLIMAVTIIGLPWVSVCFKFASYALFPFGRHAVPRTDYDPDPANHPGLFSLIRNLVWLLLAGWWLALFHAFWAVLYAITIIGLPFAWAHVKLAALALWPVGKTIVGDDDLSVRLAPVYRRGGQSGR